MAKARAPEAERSFSPAFAPRGLSRLEAAQHVRVSPSYFDQMVRDGRMPQPKRIGSRVVWDRLKVEAYFEALPEEGDEGGSPEDSFADWQ